MSSTAEGRPSASTSLYGLPFLSYWRDARGLAIAAGTEQMMKIRIVSEESGLRFNQRGG